MAVKKISRRKKGRSLWLGVDPGKTGYITAYDGERIVASWPLPWLGDEPDLDRLFKMFWALRLAGAVHAFVEHQQTFGKESAKAGFTMGGGYIALKAALKAAGIPFETQIPDQWKKAMGIPAPTVPKVPKALPRPGRGATKQVKAEYKKREGDRGRAQRARKAKRKEIACRVGQELAPGHDFRESSRCRTPHSGKVESFLLAVFCYRTHAVGGGQWR